MIYGIIDLSHNMMGKHTDSTYLRKDEFWAIRNLSFELKRGDVLGLIGVNGSGKTTLLRLLAGIFPPDKGEIRIKGRVGALIAVGAGFHPHMTGRENIYLNGTILGMDRNEIDSKFQDIVDFAEIHDFLDAPISTYSSGMRVRLGFAIAVHIEPDVMLIDEVLTVGDIGFKAKCFAAIDRLIKNAAVIFVSHEMSQVARVCTDIMLMHNGQQYYHGCNVAEGIQRYYTNLKSRNGIITGNGKATIHRIELESNGVKGIDQINYLDNLTAHLHLTVAKSVKHPIVAIYFLNQDYQIVAQCNSHYHQIPIRNHGNRMHICIDLHQIILNPSKYFVSAVVHDENQVAVLVSHYAAKQLMVTGNFVGHANMQLKGEWTVKEERAE